MAERFVVGLNQNALFWSSWAFTIAGAVATLWIGWLGMLIAFVGIASAMGFAHQKHVEKLAVEKESERIRTLLEDAERKISELPLETMLRIQQIIAASSLRQLMDEVVRYAEYVVRMVRFMESGRTLNLRTFTMRAGTLYAVSRVERTAIALLKDGDPLILTVKDSSGLVTDSAHIVVHQVDEKSGSVWFQVRTYLGDEMAHLEALAEKKDVAGLTGYSLRPLCAVERFAGFNVEDAAGFIYALAAEIIQIKGFEK
jgi:hypothetical protein